MSLAFIFDLDDTLYKRLDTFTAAFADTFSDGSSLRTRTGELVYPGDLVEYAGEEIRVV